MVFPACLIAWSVAEGSMFVYSPESFFGEVFGFALSYGGPFSIAVVVLSAFFSWLQDSWKDFKYILIFLVLLFAAYFGTAYVADVPLARERRENVAVAKKLARRISKFGMANGRYPVSLSELNLPAGPCIKIHGTRHAVEYELLPGGDYLLSVRYGGGFFDMVCEYDHKKEKWISRPGP